MYQSEDVMTVPGCHQEGCHQEAGLIFNVLLKIIEGGLWWVSHCICVFELCGSSPYQNKQTNKQK